MQDDDALRAGAGEPLDLWLEDPSAPADLPDLRQQRFELSSRGDRVPGRLLLPPAGEGPYPLVLLQHGLGGSKEAPYLTAAAGPWVRAGAAVASIDFPLHGERASAKLPAQLLRGLAGGAAPNASARALPLALVRQAVTDLERTLDALAEHPLLDPHRIAYAGFSMGAMLGALFCGADPRPRAAALALAGGGFGPAETDPARFIGRFAPRPLLFVNAERDEVIPRSATEALYAAAGEPKQILWFDTNHAGLRGVALKAMWSFLRPQLGLGGTQDGP
jgi:dienelactone hydrolase